MKRLLLLRHAKSSWKEPALSDFDRPLNKRGRTAARLMADYMAREGFRPDLVLCSSAKRTTETMAYLTPVIGSNCTLRIDRALYLASCEQLLNILGETSPDFQTVLLIGHNPGLAQLARLLGKKGDMEARRELKTKFPTAALAVIDSPNGSWRTLSTSETRLERFVGPKDFRPDSPPSDRLPTTAE